MVNEGYVTSRVVEMIRDIASAIINGYISRLAETTHLQSNTERLKLCIKRTYHAKEEIDNIMKVIGNMARFQISIMRMIYIIS